MQNKSEQSSQASESPKAEALQKELSEIRQELFDTNQELMVLTLELDDRVAKRTAALELKNRELQQEVYRRIKAEKESNEAKKKWENIFQAIGHMGMILDCERNIVAANSAVLNTLNLRQNEIIGKKCCQVLYQSDTPIEECPLTEILNGTQVDTFEKELEINDKSYLVSCTPVFDEENNLNSIIHIATNITHIKELEKDLIQAQKMEAIGTLAGGIAHDFNNILSIILGYSALSEELAGSNSELRENLHEINRASVRARDLVQQILTFARKSDEDLEPLEVQLMAKEILKLLRSTIPSSIEIRDHIDSTGLVMANPTQLHQIFMNLATNAVHAVDQDGGRLKVSVSDLEIMGVGSWTHPVEPGKYVLVEVEDNGIGIPRENLTSIFEPYFTTKKKDEGTGLGLAVVHGIVKNYGGEIFVESKEHTGTRFSVYLPQAEPKKSSGPAMHDEIPGGSEHILIVDDEMPIAKMIARVLGSLGYSTTYLTSSKKALETFSQDPSGFDAVVSDVTMPEMTGDVLAKKIKAIDPLVPIILCTGYNRKVNHQSAKKLGIHDLLSKPIEKKILARSIRSALDKASAF